MKLSATTTVLLASAVGLAAAQSSDAVGDLPGGEALPSDAAGGAGGIDTDNIPSCFISCLTTTMPAGDCSLTDTECLCNDDQYIDSLQSCGATNCDTQDDIDAAQSAAESVCQQAGVSLDLSSIEPSSASETSASAGAQDEEDDDDSAAQQYKLGGGVLAGAVAAFMATF